MKINNIKMIYEPAPLPGHEDFFHVVMELFKDDVPVYQPSDMSGSINPGGEFILYNGEEIEADRIELRFLDNDLPHSILVNDKKIGVINSWAGPNRDEYSFNLNNSSSIFYIAIGMIALVVLLNKSH
jgi:hypothetical protein